MLGRRGFKDRRGQRETLVRSDLPALRVMWARRGLRGQLDPRGTQALLGHKEQRVTPEQPARLVAAHRPPLSPPQQPADSARRR